MSAIVHDLVADEARQFNLSFIWYDRNGDPVELDNYGAIMEVRSLHGNALVSRITHETGIILHTEEGDEGLVEVSLPATDLNNPLSYNCQYEIVLHPDEDDPDDRPTAILRGKFEIRKKIAKLT